MSFITANNNRIYSTNENCMETVHPFNVAMMERRTALNLSYKNLADRIGGCSRSYISDIEKGRYVVSVELGLAICQVLNIPVSFCIDYIKVKEAEKVQRSIEREYNKWVASVPTNVLNKMLESESSKELHVQLLEGSECLELIAPAKERELKHSN